MVGQNRDTRHDRAHATIFCDCARKIINGWYDEVSIKTVDKYYSN